MTVLVSDIMRRGLVTCPPETTLGEAAALLVRERVHAVVVADVAGAPAGVLADSDLLAGEWLAGDEVSLDAMRRLTAGELMSAPLTKIDAAAGAAEAAERMLAERVSRLVVVEDGAPAGMIAVSDLVASAAGQPGGRGTVEDVMSRGFVACRPETPAAGLARAMTERRSRSVVVLDVGGTAVGVVTGRDLLPLAAAEDLDGKTAGDLMHPPLAIGPDATLREAADRLVREEVHRLVVADPDGGVPLGIVSTWDVLAEMAGPGSPWR
ncbi:MAG TPA: CBS domain-containing protein [Gaiellaceae bacterium]|nr:CBS domain-containing protein [Gaiellaceae bacterium]